MNLFEVIINCIVAGGALATAGAFIYIIKGQKGTQKQIESLSKMAEISSRQYEMARIQAGNTIYPKIKISFRQNQLLEEEIVVKNYSYPIEIYRIVVHSNSFHSDITINRREDYIGVGQGEAKVVPGNITRAGLMLFSIATVRLFVITPFEEAYEIRYAGDGDQHPYQSDPIPVLYTGKEHQFGKRSNSNYTTKQYSIHGNIPGDIVQNFPEVNEDPRDITLPKSRF